MHLTFSAAAEGENLSGSVNEMYVRVPSQGDRDVEPRRKLAREEEGPYMTNE